LAVSWQDFSLHGRVRPIISENEQEGKKMKTEASKKSALTKEVLQRMDAYWRAANYLSVGQIYLLDNPLLQKPLTLEHIKARLLGHWGTTPGLNFVYVHLNRIIKKHDLSMMYIAGPGHGGPGLVANTYLEGTYSEVYPRRCCIIQKPRRDSRRVPWLNTFSLTSACLSSPFGSEPCT
jgi:hypothetical protein